MLTYIIGAIILAVIVFLIVVAVQPDNFRISRSATITAPAPLVFAQVNDFHQWQAWSPWAKMDPTAKNTFEGAASGEGAVLSLGGKQPGRRRRHDDSRKPSGSAYSPQAQLPQAVPGHSHGRVHLRAAAGIDAGDVDHVREEQLRVESIPPVHGLRQDDRRPVRARP